jgi:peptidoglycan/xylan/chitin deacetylase (PgdA/CDA1 family)
MTSLPGVFTMSFDCEGLWGPSVLTPSLRERITQDRLRATYQTLIDLLDRHDLRATFAFVGAFVLSPEEVRQHPDWFASASGRQWPRTQEFRTAIAQGQTSGWLSPECFDIVQRNGRQELATHGFQHLALRDHALTRDDFEQELALAADVGRLKGFTPRTLVFPRNQVGFADSLATAGIIGFRDYIGMNRLSLPLSEQWQVRCDALAALGREVKVWQKPQPHPPGVSSVSGGRPSLRSEHVIPFPRTSGPGPTSAVAIPSGYFLNWRVGLRRRIPIKLSVARWSQMLSRAARSGGMVHLWSHPHNFITGDQQLEFLGEILREASAWIRRGDLLNLTQEQYSEHFLGRAVAARPASAVAIASALRAG